MNKGDRVEIVVRGEVTHVSRDRVSVDWDEPAFELATVHVRTGVPKGAAKAPIPADATIRTTFYETGSGISEPIEYVLVRRDPARIITFDLLEEGERAAEIVIDLDAKKLIRYRWTHRDGGPILSWGAIENVCSMFGIEVPSPEMAKTSSTRHRGVELAKGQRWRRRTRDEVIVLDYVVELGAYAGKWQVRRELGPRLSGPEYRGELNIRNNYDLLRDDEP